MIKKNLKRRAVFVGLLLSFTFALQAQTNVIRVKFASSQSAVLKNTSVSLNSAGYSQIGIRTFDQLNAQYNATQMKRVFPYAGKYEAKHIKYGLDLWYEITIDSTVTDLEAVTKDYASLSMVEVVEQNQPKAILPYKKGKIFSSKTTNSLTDEVNDPEYADQWHYNNTGQTGGTVDADIDLPEAWTMETGNSNVIVSIHDGGIDYDHEDLIGNMWVNSGEIAGNGIDDDNNGYIDDIYGYSFVDETADITAHDHGTHVGGTVAAETNNGIGVAGVAGGTGNDDGIRLMSCAIFDASSNSGGMANSYVYAADNGSVISQNSWGYTTSGVYEQSILDGIDYFIAEAGYDEDGEFVGPLAGGIVIFAAGNDGINEDVYPGYYDHVHAVGSTDLNDEASYFSNYGDWVDISAPGSSIMSTYPDDSYGTMSGTSMACPHVSGVAALIVSKFYDDNLTPDEVWNKLADNVDPLTFDDADLYGAGRLNAYQSLLVEEVEAPNAIEDLTILSFDATTASFTLTAPADLPDGGPVSAYILRYSQNEITTENYTEAEQVEISGPSLPGSTDTLEVAVFRPGNTYYVAIQSSDYFSNESSISNVVSFTTDEASEITLSGDPSVSIDVSVDSTETGSFNIANTGSVDLTFDILASYTGRSSLASTSVYTAGEVSIVPETTLAEQEVEFIANQNENLDASLNFVTNFEDALIYDDGDDSCDGDLAVTSDGDPVDWGAASSFEVPDDYEGTFTLTHITSFITASSSTSETTLVSIVKGGNTPADGEVLLSEEFQNEDGEGFDTLALSIPQEFVAGDRFWIVYSYEAVSIRLGYDDITDGTREYGYYAYYGDAWTDLQSLSGYETYVWCIRALESSVEGITFSLNSGTIAPGGSQDIDVNFDANLASTNGKYTYNIVINSNDPVNPTSVLSATATVTGYPLPAISVDPDTVKSVIDAFENPIQTETLTLVNSGPGTLKYSFNGPVSVSSVSASKDFTLPEGYAKELHIGVAPSQENRSTTSSSASAGLLASGTLAYGMQSYPDYNFVTFTTSTPTAFTSTMAIDDAAYIWAADFGPDDDSYMYYNNYSTYEFGRINVETGEMEVIGNNGTGFMDFACNKKTGTMYASYLNDDGETDLYTVDLETGDITEIGSNGDDVVICSMACDGDGNLWGINMYGDYSCSIDTTTGEATTIGETGFVADYAQSMSWDPESNTILVAAYYYDTDEGYDEGQLRIFDTETGETEYLGTFEDAAEIAAIAFPGTESGSFITSISKTTGSVPGNSSVDIELTLDATLLPDGDYTNTLTIYSNDEDNAALEVPVLLNVYGQVGEVSASTDYLDFGTSFQYGTETTELEITNNGVGDLTLYKILSDNAYFTTNFGDSVTISSGKSASYAVSFSADETGLFTATLQVISDDPDNDTLEIVAAATAIAPPVLEATTDSIATALESGESTTVYMTISNTGAYPLQFSIPDTAITDAEEVNLDPFTVLPVTTGGVLLPGKSKELGFVIDADTLIEGSYLNKLTITTNDPTALEFVLTNYLEVTGFAAIETNLSSVDFGGIVKDISETREIEISNTGTKNLSISSIESTDAAFVIDADLPLTIKPGKAKSIEVTFTPTAISDYSASLTLVSNDAYGNTSLVLPLSGAGLTPPLMAYSYDPLTTDFVVNHGTTDTMTVTLENQGQADLTYNIARPYFAKFITDKEGSAVSYNPDFVIGGSDSIGYYWSDNTRESSISYTWLDISSKGTSLTLGSDGSEAVALPFEFSFYGETYEEVFVAANGFLSFDSDLGSLGGYENQDIPNTEAANNVIAAFWHDLEPAEGTGVYYYAGDDYAVIAYDAVPVYNQDDSASFEIILYATGDIKIQYKDVTSSTALENCTVGLENADGTTGLPIAYNEAFLSDELAIYITSPYIQGTVAEGSSEKIEMYIETKDLNAGKYTSELVITSNDPENASYTIPASLTVVGTPDISADTVKFDGVYYVEGMNFTGTQDLEITNSGSDTLKITSMQIIPAEDIVTADLSFPTYLLPGESFSNTLSFTPAEMGSYEANIQIESNDTSTNGISLIPIVAKAVMPPSLQVAESDTLKLDLFSEEVVSTERSVSNNGTGILNYTIKAFYPISDKEGTSSSELNTTVVDSMVYDPATDPEEYDGFNGYITYKAANKFTVSSASFTLTHVRAFYQNEGSTDSITMKVWKGGSLPEAGTLVAQQSYYHEDATEGAYNTLELAEPVEFNEGDVFYVALYFPKSIDSPAAINTEVTAGDGNSYKVVLLTQQWTTLDEGETFKIRAYECTESASIENWLRITPATGSLEEGNSTSHSIIADAGKVMAGTYNGIAKYVSNDYNNPIVNVAVQINVNAAPVVTTSPADSMSLAEGESVDALLTAYDPDGGDISFTVSPATDFISLQVSNDSAYLSIAPGYKASGIYKLALNTIDDEGESVSDSLYIEVLDVNTNPRIIADIENRTYGLNSESETLDLATYFEDIDGDELSYSVTVNDSEICYASIADSYLTLSPQSIGSTIISVQAQDPSGKYTMISFSVTVNETTGISNDKQATVGISNYPNPASEKTTFEYTTVEASQVCLKVYFISGKVVDTLVDEYQSAGGHSLEYDTSGLAQGTYIYELLLDGVKTKQNILIVY